MKTIKDLIILGFLTLISLTSFSQVVKRSKVCGYNNSFEMTITYDSSGNVEISNIAVTQLESDIVWVYAIDGHINDSSYLVWPNDGSNYWFVYFNPTLTPVKMAIGGGSTGPVVCSCTGTGQCNAVPTSNGVGCSNVSCTHCCEESEGPALVNSGGGILIKSVSITLNGTLYN